MFVAIHKTTGEYVEIFGPQATAPEEVKCLCEARLLICDECQAPLWYYDDAQIPFLGHPPIHLLTKDCRKRFASLVTLYREQVLLFYPDFRSPFDDYLEKQFAQEHSKQKQDYVLDKPTHGGPVDLPEEIFCVVCEQKTTEWAAARFLTKQGKCKHCLLFEHLLALVFREDPNPTRY